MTTPVFTATNSNSANLPTVTTANRFANWSVTLPTLRPGQYRLYMRATNAQGTQVNQNVLFSINDASPEVTITAPASGSTLTQGSRSTATGTAYDKDGIDSVLVRLVRKAEGNNKAAYWNSTRFDETYNPALHEMTATSTDGFATWSLDLPALEMGNYTIYALAKDTLGNYSAANKGAVAKSVTLLNESAAIS